MAFSFLTFYLPGSKRHTVNFYEVLVETMKPCNTTSLVHRQQLHMTQTALAGCYPSAHIRSEGYSVCLCVCQHLLALQVTRQCMSDTNSFSATNARILKWRFCKKDCVRERETGIVVDHAACPNSSIIAVRMRVHTVVHVHGECPPPPPPPPPPTHTHTQLLTLAHRGGTHDCAVQHCS